MPDKWSSNWDLAINKQPPSPTEEEQAIVREAKDRFRACVDYEAQARLNFEFDYKFANGDSHNNYQWDTTIISMRQSDATKPCLTINKTQQHNLMVINDSKQNKPGIRIRPVGDESSYDAAQVYQELIYHIEYISNAENIYDSAMTYQVEAGIGYWRVLTKHIDNKTFDQEIYISRIKDPRSVYLDPNITEQDGSDAWFGFIFDDVDKNLFAAKYPDYAAIAGSSVLGENNPNDTWVTQNNVRVAEYFRKKQTPSKLVRWIDPDDGIQIEKQIDELSDAEKEIYKVLKSSGANMRQVFQFQERKILIDNIEWFKIAGDRVIEGLDIDDRRWAGKYIPIVRLPGVETLIDGVLDRKGHTRALIDPQRMYNWNASADVEYGALQTKVPWIAASAAIEGFEEYFKTANTINHSYLPYNAYDDEGRELPPPQRPAPPQPSPAYVQRMELSINEMMMASGQYQAQFGQNENAKSGVAINARQRQGDRATYHFLDNQAMAIRFTGKIILDLIPKIYDTKRVMRITSRDGTVMNVTVDPNAPQAFMQQQSEEQDKEEKIKEIIFNPNVGNYDIQSDTGPSYATRRMEAFNALTQIAAQNKDFMHIGGDLYFKVADFPEADVLAQRYRRAIPPAILGEGPDAETEALMNQASETIQKYEALIQQQAKELADKDRELAIKEQDTLVKKGDLKLKVMEADTRENREDYDAETRRLTAIANAGESHEGLPMKELKPLLEQLLKTMKGDNLDEEEPPIEGARKAPDGRWYVENPEGGYMMVE